MDLFNCGLCEITVCESVFGPVNPVNIGTEGIVSVIGLLSMQCIVPVQTHRLNNAKLASHTKWSNKPYDIHRLESSNLLWLMNFP